MKNLKNIILGAVILFMASCSFSGPVIVPKALVTKNPVGDKVGIAETKVWLGLFPMDIDVSIATAAKKGKITKIATVDSEVQGGFLSTTYRTIVTGTNDEVEEEPKKGRRKRRSRSRSRRK